MPTECLNARINYYINYIVQDSSQPHEKRYDFYILREYFRHLSPYSSFVRPDFSFLPGFRWYSSSFFSSVLFVRPDSRFSTALTGSGLHLNSLVHSRFLLCSCFRPLLDPCHLFDGVDYTVPRIGTRVRAPWISLRAGWKFFDDRGLPETTTLPSSPSFFFHTD